MFYNHILAGSICLFLFLYFKYGFAKEKKTIKPMPEDDIELAFKYHEKKIERLPLDDMKINKYYGELKHFQDVFFFHPARDYWFDKLNIIIQMKLNEAWLMETRVLDMN